ncbi:NadD Nicotinic acid mononucleotide adenylyltransferase [Burkholderiaceae bacterium]
MRIGLFGGAFDPPHNAHVALAQAALRQLSLNVLHVLPTGDAWHKPRDLTPGHHRLAMCQQAFESFPNVVVDDLELKRPGPSYTVDTLAVLRERYAGAEFFVVLGLDQAAQFVHWHQSDQILAWAQLAIADRSLEGQEKAASPEWHNRAHLHLNMPLMPLSATDIRQRCRTGEDLSALLSTAVIRYIQNNHLYLDNHDRSF